MTFSYLKRGAPIDAAASADVSTTVARLLAEIEAGGEAAATRIAREFDRWDGDIILSDDTIDAACARVPQSLKDDIAYAHENIARFAKAQRDSFTETEIELRPGLRAGQKLIPVQAAGCYIPGGRYSHIASAMMTVTTAKVAGVAHVAAVSPPRADAPAGIPDAILYTLHHCGADRVLALGGIQGVAAMAFGLFGLPPADILVGPGNQFVAEAKRLLYGRVGIDMVAGPTDSMVIADATADALVVAWDLVGQAEHGANSPVWLVTTSPQLAAEVRRLVPGLIVGLKALNAQVPLLGIGVRVPKETQEANVFRLAQAVEEKMGLQGVVSRADVVANCDYIGQGYGIPADSTLEAIDVFARQEAILLDPVYSGKGAAGLIDLIRKGHFKTGERVVFLHTGGAIGLTGYTHVLPHL